MFKKIWFEVVVIGLVFLFLTGFVTGCEEEVAKVLREKYAHTPLTPPSKLLPPGTIVVIRDEAPFKASVVCGKSGAFGEGFSLLESDTMDFSELKNQTFTISPEKLQLINKGIRAELGGGIEYVKNITFSLEDPKLFELTDEEVQNRIASHTEACANAVSQRIKGGQQLTMIKSVIQASVNYKLEFDWSVDANAKLELTRDIAPGLSLDFSDVTEDTVKGENLYWGIVDDAFLFGVLAQGMGAFEGLETIPVLEEKRRLIPSEAEIEVIVEE